jgi:hypothetical protein
MMPRAHDSLAGSSGSGMRMSFAELEELIGRVPDSAHRLGWPAVRYQRALIR